MSPEFPAENTPGRPGADARGEMHAALDRILDGAEGYDGTANAARDAIVTVFDHAADELGLTGFQASWAALAAYAKVMHWKGGGIVFRDEDLLYPQYDHMRRLRERLNDPETVKWLGEEAAKLLAERDIIFTAPHVVEHWERLVAQAGISGD